jgi:hypothetical protein
MYYERRKRKQLKKSVLDERQLVWDKAIPIHVEIIKPDEEFNTPCLSHECCVCGRPRYSKCLQQIELRFIDEAGFVCHYCWLFEKRCECGKIQVINKMCRECYIESDVPVLENYVYKSRFQAEPEPAGKLSGGFNKKLVAKMRELGYDRLEKQLYGNRVVMPDE